MTIQTSIANHGGSRFSSALLSWLPGRRQATVKQPSEPATPRDETVESGGLTSEAETTEAVTVVQERDPPTSPPPSPFDPPLVSPSPPPLVEQPRRRRGQPAAPDAAATLIQARLFSLLGDARLESGGFDTDGVLHKLLLYPSDVDDLAAVLAKPFADGSKKIAAVVGLGGYGSVLAFSVAKILPQYPFGEDEFRKVSFLSLDRGSSEKSGHWRLASPKDGGNLLRNKRVLIVAPVLTAATCADIQACVKLLEEGLSVNATVIGVSALFQLECSGTLPRGRTKGFETRSELRLDFQAFSGKTA